MARKRSSAKRTEAKKKQIQERNRLNKTLSHQKALKPDDRIERVVVSYDDGRVIGEFAALAPIVQGWPRASHTKVVMDFCETWGSEGLAALFSPRQSFKVA